MAIPESTIAFDTAPAPSPFWVGPVIWGLAVGLVFVGMIGMLNERGHAAHR